MALIPGEDVWWVYRAATAMRDARMWRPWARMLLMDAATEIVAVEAEAVARRAEGLSPPYGPGALRNSLSNDAR